MLNWDKFEKGFKEYNKSDYDYIEEIKKKYFANKKNEKKLTEKKEFTREYEDFNITKVGAAQIITRRMKVPTGWLVQTVFLDVDENYHEIVNSIDVNFISDPNYVWCRL